MVANQLISGETPRSETTPLMSKFLTHAMILNTVSLLGNVAIMVLYHSEDSFNLKFDMGRTPRYWFLQILPAILRVNPPKYPIDMKKTDDGMLESKIQESPPSLFCLKTYKFPKHSLLQEKQIKKRNYLLENKTTITTSHEILSEIKKTIKALEKSMCTEERESLGVPLSIKDYWQFSAEIVDKFLFYLFSIYLLTISVIYLLPLLLID